MGCDFVQKSFKKER